MSPLARYSQAQKRSTARPRARLRWSDDAETSATSVRRGCAWGFVARRGSDSSGEAQSKRNERSKERDAISER